MTLRSLVAIALIVIVAFEVFLFLNIETSNHSVTTGQVGTGSGFKRFLNSTIKTEVVPDIQSKEAKEKKYIILIGATLIAGGIAVFATPNKKISLNSKEEEA